MRTFLAALSVGAAMLSVPARADDTRQAPGAVFAPKFDGVCALGAHLSEGCAAIRAREPVDTTRAPLSAIGRVNFASTNVRHHCTGTLVSERHVLTAAHCLYNGPRRSWIPASSLRFLAGYQRGKALAHAAGRRYWLAAGQEASTQRLNRAPRQDWAIVELDAPIGQQVGFLEVTPGPEGELQESYLIGYPGLRPHLPSMATDCGSVLRAGRLGVFAGACSAMHGDSGAPLLTTIDGVPKILGVFSSIAVDQSGAFHSLVVPTAEFIERLTKETASAAD